VSQAVPDGQHVADGHVAHGVVPDEQLSESEQLDPPDWATTVAAMNATEAAVMLALLISFLRMDTLILS
jgi:hypothetical protein